jgi:hypothetical protein
VLIDSNIIDVVDMSKIRVCFDKIKQWKLYISCGIILLFVLVQRSISSREDTHRDEPLKWRRDEVLSMSYAEICPKVRRHNARSKGRALCLLTLGHISSYSMMSAFNSVQFTM